MNKIEDLIDNLIDFFYQENTLSKIENLMLYNNKSIQENIKTILYINFKKENQILINTFSNNKKNQSNTLLKSLNIAQNIDFKSDIDFNSFKDRFKLEMTDMQLTLSIIKFEFYEYESTIDHKEFQSTIKQTRFEINNSLFECYNEGNKTKVSFFIDNKLSFIEFRNLFCMKNVKNIFENNNQYLKNIDENNFSFDAHHKDFYIDLVQGMFHRSFCFKVQNNYIQNYSKQYSGYIQPKGSKLNFMFIFNEIIEISLMKTIMNVLSNIIIDQIKMIEDLYKNDPQGILMFDMHNSGEKNQLSLKYSILDINESKITKNLEKYNDYKKIENFLVDLFSRKESNLQIQSHLALIYNLPIKTEYNSDNIEQYQNYLTRYRRIYNLDNFINLMIKQDENKLKNHLIDKRQVLFQIDQTYPYNNPINEYIFSNLIEIASNNISVVLISNLIVNNFPQVLKELNNYKMKFNQQSKIVILIDEILNSEILYNQIYTSSNLKQLQTFILKILFSNQYNEFNLTNFYNQFSENIISLIKSGVINIRFINDVIKYSFNKYAQQIIYIILDNIESCYDNIVSCETIINILENQDCEVQEYSKKKILSSFNVLMQKKYTKDFFIQLYKNGLILDHFNKILYSLDDLSIKQFIQQFCSDYSQNKIYQIFNNQDMGQINKLHQVKTIIKKYPSYERIQLKNYERLIN